LGAAKYYITNSVFCFHGYGDWGVGLTQGDGEVFPPPSRVFRRTGVLLILLFLVHETAVNIGWRIGCRIT